MMLSQWVEEHQRLLELEQEEEQQQLSDRIAALSAKQCQVMGLSLLNLEIDQIKSSLFGRSCVVLRRQDGGPIPQTFKSGDEVSLFNSKLLTNNAHGRSSASGNQTPPEVLQGLLSRVTSSSVEVVAEDVDEQLLPAPLRLDLRSSFKTHRTMRAALSALRVARHPLAHLLFTSKSEAALPYPLQQQRGTTAKLQFQLNQSLNASQLQAIECALSASHIALIHGPPGTGKTSTLTELILQAAARGMRVLVCSPSNIAVDTILLRLADALSNVRPVESTASGDEDADASVGTYPPPNHATARNLTALQMVRLGHPARISESILRYSLDAIISRDEGTEIVQDVRRDIEAMRKQMQEMQQHKGKSKMSKASRSAVEEAGGIGKARREMRSELRQLNKEAKARERTVVQRILKRSNIVLSTCIGASTSLLSKKNGSDQSSGELPFDLVVIDEAAQGLEAACWVPILLGKHCVLAGDHCQLPPTIKSADAEKGGLVVTLFERVINDERFASVVRLLDTQYRMNKLISNWASHCMYNGLIRSHASVAEHTLRDLLPMKDRSDDDTTDDTDEHSDFPVLLLVDSSGCGMLEDTVDDADHALGSNMVARTGSHRNVHEADLVVKHVLQLVKAGIPPTNIGVITPYNAQLDLLREMLLPVDNDEVPMKAKGKDKRSTMKNELASASAQQLLSQYGAGQQDAAKAVNLHGLEVKTIDGFQGGEKECILISLVRSNTNHEVGFLAEERRINVAVTRARRHLVVFCDVETVSSDRFMRGLVDHMSLNGDHISAEEYMSYFDAGIAVGDANRVSGTNIPRSTTGKTYSKIESADGNTLKGGSNTSRKIKDVIDDELRRLLSQFKEQRISGGIVLQDASGNLVVLHNDAEDDEVLTFTSKLTSYQRMRVHELAERQLQLYHRSTGEGNDRQVQVSLHNFRYQLQAPAESNALHKDVEVVKEQYVPMEAFETSPIAEDVMEPATVTLDGDDVSIEGEVVSGKNVTSGDSHGKKKKKSCKKTRKEAAVYQNPGKKKPDASFLQNANLDEDALLEAAIQSNKEWAEYTKYRIGSSGPIPNPEKEASKKKLHHAITSAHQTRVAGGGTGSSRTDDSGSGLTVSSLGGNISGFNSGSPLNANSSGATKGSGRTGSKKKVVKKPPPNFGGGKVGGGTNS